MKRGGSALTSLLATKQKTDAQTAADHASRQSQHNVQSNPFMKQPVNPEEALRIFLVQSRTEAKKNVPRGTDFPIRHPFCEIEARIGILKSAFGLHDMRVVSSGPKRVNTGGKSGVAHAFLCTNSAAGPKCFFEGGITRSHYVNWTSAGLSEVSPISQSFAVAKESIRNDILETEMVETVYGGYYDDYRVCFPGDHPEGSSHNKPGKRECKQKLSTMDIALPSAPYDLRLTLATERTTENNLKEPPRGWKTKRLKRRRSYSRKNNSFAWQLDITEVTSVEVDQLTGKVLGQGTVSYEIEMELNAGKTLELINAPDDVAHNLCKSLSKQLWWMLSQINCLSDVLDVEEFLREHPCKNSVKLAQAQCGAIKRFMDSNGQNWDSPISASGSSPDPPAALCNINFPGCMPVNFSRHNIEDVQRKEDNAYFLSEKTDGVRYFMIFTGTGCVLIDRKMNGKQPIPRPGSENGDPMSPVIPYVKQGAVLDGEVVMHRKLRRPVFIVFDVLALSATDPVLHLPFEQRKRYLEKAAFQKPDSQCDIFNKAYVNNPRITLPLVRKNFVTRMKLDSDLLRYVTEDKGLRCYKFGDIHHHLTDGIIFQPNLPYSCGTDVNLLKWKYLDTVTIDVELLPPRQSYNNNNGNSEEDTLRVGVLGDEGSMVDMTRHIQLPKSERRRLEADRHENGSKIAELGFDPTTGEWYYLTMRPDKKAPNHISTVLGTLLELAESLCTEELQYRMSVPPGVNDTWRKQTRKMQRQLLDHQRESNKAFLKRR